MKTRKLTILIALCTFFCASAFSQTIIGRQKVDQFPSSQWGGITFGLTWLPTDYNSTSNKYPLIIFLHGAGEAGSGVGGLYNLLWTAIPQKIAQGWDPAAVNPVDGQNYQFIVVSPQAPGWSCSYVQLQYILPDIISRYRIDTSRIYITGLSAGGAGTWSTVTNGFSFAKKIAAVIPVSAAGTNTPAEASQLPYVGGSYEVKVWNICGTGDSFWTSTNNFTNSINSALPAPSVPAIATGLPAGHDPGAWNTAYDPNWRNNAHSLNVYEWLLKYKRAPNASYPTANAGADQNIALPANSITLNGLATATGGNTISSYSWTKYSGQACTINSPTSASTTISGLLQGIYVFRLVAKDNQNYTAIDEVTITVLPSNSFALIPSTVQAENWFAMSGVQTENTLDAGGGINVAFIDNADWMDYNINVPVAGSYMVKFRVASLNINGQLQIKKNDGTVLSTVNVPQTAGWQSWQTVSTTINLTAGNQTLRIASSAAAGWNFNWMEFLNTTSNQAPVSNAGTDQNITLPVNTIILNGSGTDADGSIAGYSWTKISGPLSATIANASSAQTAVNNLTQGVYQFQLTVTDNLGTTDTDTTIVTVNAGVNAAPVANAGIDQTISLPTNNITLSGSGTDTDGTIATYNWIKISGPGSYNIITSSAAQTLVNNLVSGTYQFELTVTDNSGANDKDTVQVIVNALANVSPSANAGANQSVTLPLNSVTVNGSGSDTDGTIASYLWTKISGPSSYSIANALQAQTAINGLVQGVYQFELKVTDNGGATAVDTIQITVNGTSNNAPIANAGINQLITLPINSALLSGSGTDADGTIISYSWAKISGPAASALVNANQASTLVNNLVQGVYSFEFTVTDNAGAAGKDTILITVNGITNQIPVSNAGNDITITLPVDTINLTGSGTDSDGTITSYLWTKISGPSSYTIVNVSQDQTAINNLVQGVYKFELKVTDNSGATDTDTVQVTVNAPGNIAPSSNAGVNQTITLPVNALTLNGSGTDTDGTITSYSWTKISGPSSFIIVNALQAQTAINGLVQGVYQFELKVTDNLGATGIDTVQVTVNIAANILPSANAGADQTITLPVSSLTLNGGGTDTDGTITSYLWTKISGPASYTIVNAAQAQTAINGLVQGVYKFELKVSDNGGATGTDTVQINVNGPANIPPSANAGANQSIILPANSVTLNGAGTDADGTITSFVWSKISGPATYTITSPNTQNTTVTGLVQGTYIFKLTVTDNNGSVGTDDIQISVTSCNGVRRNMVPWSDMGVYHSGKPGGFNYMAYNPGDTLVIKKSYGTWNYFAIEDFNGTPACPLVIINEGDQVSMTKGFTLTNCSNIKITGSGSALQYGFYIHNPAANDNNGVAIAIGGRSKNIEVEKIFVHKKTYGAWIKQDPGCVDSLNYPNYHMDNVKMHDCKFLNMGQSAIYAGNTDPNGTRPVTCNGIITYPKPMRLSNIQIYNNIIDSCLRSGIQLCGADSGYNAIFNNTVTRTGYEMNQQQGTGISIGGMTRNCHVYNNTVRSTFLYGIMSFGMGTNYIENNTIDSSGYLNGVANAIGLASGIYIDTRNTVPLDSSKAIILNNKIGKSVSAHDHDIFFNKTLPTYAVGNQICGNTKLDGITPAKYYLQAGINFTNCLPQPPGNILPVANAGIDQTLILPTNTGILFGSMMDPDGTIWSVSWTKISGPSSFAIVPPNQPYTYINSLLQGVYHFEMKITDNQGGVDRDTMILTVLAAPPNNLPIANAGADQTITLPVNSVQLNGSGADTDGTITSYQWTKLTGPSQFTIASATAAQTAVTSLAQGVYTFELKVTDNLNGAGRDTVSITVNPAPNVPPVANAGPDQSIVLPVNTITLGGSGTDVNGTIVSYAWAKISGPSQFTIASPNDATTIVSNLIQGVYSFQLTVTDNSGSTATDAVNITVYNAPSVNNPPVANAGNNISITLPVSNTVLNGSGTDSDGSISSYNWTKISGPSQFVISNPSSAQTNINNLVQGIYEFRLVIADNSGATDDDTIKVAVNPPVNIPPIANAGADLIVILPNSAQLNGLAIDVDGTIAYYQWTKIAGPTQYTISNPATAQTIVSNLLEGIYTFQLQVVDNNGAPGVDTIMVTVNTLPNIVPTAIAGNDINITLPNNSVQLNGGGFDIDGTIASYQWIKVSGPASFNLVSPSDAQTSVTDMAAGVYVFELRVTDNRGAVGTDAITITVTDPPNIAPIVQAGRDTVIMLPNNTIILEGGAMDPDGQVVSYRWSKIEGPVPYVFTTRLGADASVQELVEGNYVFELEVTDNRGAIARDTIKVRVENLPASKASVFPNPATSSINIKIEAKTLTNLTSLVVYDVKGIAVYHETFLRTQSSMIKQLDISHLPSGVYFVKIGADINSKVSCKFIKM